MLLAFLVKLVLDASDMIWHPCLDLIFLMWTHNRSNSRIEERKLFGSYSLHLLLLSLFLSQVLLYAVVQNRTHAKRLVLLNQRFDGVLVLTRNKLTVEGHFHQFLEEPLAKNLFTEVHQLRMEKK